MLGEDAELLQEFVVESTEHLSDVEGQLLKIEELGADIDVELVNTVFRAVHSVKGAAGFLGLTTINELAHNLENVLNLIRNQELVPAHETVNTLLSSADTLRTLVEDVASSNEVDVSEQVAALKKIYDSQGEDGTIADDAAEIASTVTEAVATDAPVEPASSSIEFVSSDAEQAAPESPAPQPATPEAAPAAAAPAPEQPPAPKPAPAPVAKAPAASAAAKQPPKQPARQPESNVRVNVSILDRLMNLAGELVLGRNQLLQAVTGSSRDQLEDISARLDHVTSELQEAIMQTRMQQVGTVFNRFPRVVRDLSSKLGKNCTLEIEGNEVELDKTIIEAIGDPLTHLVRNSVDHGIESPADRVAAGKAPEGVIRLRAFHQAGKVCIRIEDNGGGIDAEKVKAKAISNGLIGETEAAAMSNADALRLIFAPGFSTAAAVTDVSGRGVGMDVVRTNIEQIGGTVEVESEVGVGSAMHITLPLTLAIIPSMIIGCGKEKYALPQTNIAELVRVQANEIENRICDVQGAEVLRLRGSLLPLVRLEKVLNFEAPSAEASKVKGMNVIVVESGQYRYGIAVDELFDSEEIVVKPLGKELRDVAYLAGATILGDGYVALILDISGIASVADMKGGEEANSKDEEGESTEAEEKHRLLLFENAPGEQFAIPMACISRIERAAIKDMLHLGDETVLPYQDRTLPLLAMEDHIKAMPRAEDLTHVFVVVFTVGNREVGLIAPNLLDICNIELKVDGGTLREPGVAGVIVLDEQPLRLIDAVEMTRTSHPEWIDVEEEEVEGNKHILVAEDSGFFRKHVESCLVEAGYTVTTGVDGQDAWEKLLEMEELPYAVVTDIEMPRLDGLGFCRKIRAEQRTSHLPVVALTSLASDDDLARGKEAGINDYQIKMDRESLLGALQSFAKK